MTRRNPISTAVQRVPFTLIELLTVMVIAAILLAVTVPVIVKITSGSSVEAGARMVGAQLRLARQEAITKRKYVAVLFPTVNSGTDAVAWVGFRPCIVINDSGIWRFDKWVENVPWSYVPTGAVMAEADDDFTSGTPPQPDLLDGTTTTVSPPNPVPTPNPFGFTGAVRAVVFRPAGRLASGTQRGVTLVEGAIVPGTSSFDPANPANVRNRSNWINIKVNQFTGRVSFGRPENP